MSTLRRKQTLDMMVLSEVRHCRSTDEKGGTKKGADTSADFTFRVLLTPEEQPRAQPLRITIQVHGNRCRRKHHMPGSSSRCVSVLQDKSLT
jgi:hypothetical protein